MIFNIKAATLCQHEAEIGDQIGPRCKGKVLSNTVNLRQLVPQSLHLSPWDVATVDSKTSTFTFTDPPLVRENLVEHTELIFKCAFFLFPVYLILADTERLPLTTAEARSGNRPGRERGTSQRVGLLSSLQLRAT